MFRLGIRLLLKLSFNILSYFFLAKKVRQKGQPEKYTGFSGTRPD